MDAQVLFSEPPEEAAPQRPALPLPTTRRWQPLRIGLVELYHYDSEEFWFRDGHLLLRGNNGTGKSKVLSLTLPFLLDAQAKPSRVEPDGDAGKRMSWNLLMGRHARRIGYAWLEFGRIADDGSPRFLTLGAGLQAAEGRPQMDSWYFIVEDAAGAPRVNQDLWLTNDSRVVLTRERLRELLGEAGQVFDTASSYRRAVDERLFRLGIDRYGALMDTLIQLRQPQLSRKPDERALSDALSEALPPLPADLVAEVADALSRLDDDRRQLEEYQALAHAVAVFERRYRIYAGTRSRREAASLRAAQTEYDNASRARNEAQSRLEAAVAEERHAEAVSEQAEVALAGERARQETLWADPANQDANRLDESAREAERRRGAVAVAEREVEKAGRRADVAGAVVRDLEARAEAVESRLATARRDSAGHAHTAGIAAAFAKIPLAAADAVTLVALTVPRFETACAALRELAGGRRRDIGLIRTRLSEVDAAEQVLALRRETRDEEAARAARAVREREAADHAVDTEGQRHVDAFTAHFAGLRRLTVEAAAADAAVTALTEWVRTLAHGDPARRLLATAHHDYLDRSARQRAALAERRQAIALERGALEQERERLQRGVDTGPPVPHARAGGTREGRAGGPLWQLVDFAPAADAGTRAGLEAALEASGLLDAWLSPDGQLQSAEGGAPILDVQALPRRSATTPLGAFLHPAVPEGCAVPATTVTAVLAGIACAAADPGDCEAWVAPDGRFRLGALAGAFAKPEAVYVGFAARHAARVRRLAAIAARLDELAADLGAVEAAAGALRRDDGEAEREWHGAPADEALRHAHVVAAARARDATDARDRLAEADTRFRDAETALRGARDRLAADAGDLALPVATAALQAVEAAVDGYGEAQSRLCHAVSDLRQLMPELQRQRSHLQELLDDQRVAGERRSEARGAAQEAEARLAVLRESVGAKVEELRRQLAQARAAVTAGEQRLKTAGEALRQCGQTRAVAGADADRAKAEFERRSAERAEAVAGFQKFATSGLLQAAWPEAPLPDPTVAWTIDPALGLARRTEQELAEVRSDRDAWDRVQKEVAADVTELQRSLSARGHQAQVEPTDWGLVVHILYQGRPQRPDSLRKSLEEEIAARDALLSAREREILENHLETEIAYEIQRLVQAAEAQRVKINQELHVRPTSTGVRYRLLWEALREEEGAPVGLEAARRRLLHTGTDLWTAEDRSVVGTMLQQRIAAERAGTSAGGGTLADQLARALDYRRWHRFRVERWQDGSWRKLSGPASSGERALGLTIPLFAAVASFYSQGGYDLTPRLILLDEAFAGIDDAARAHCMGLIRAFDLDFVITSEREWACYAELPGVAICQLQRREGIDAVYVSRWTWDGRARSRQADPDRRFAPS